MLGEQTGNPQRHHRCRVTDVVDGIGEQRDAARQHDEVLDRNPHFHLHSLQTSNMAAIKACEDTPGVFSGLRSGRVAAKMPFVLPIRDPVGEVVRPPSYPIRCSGCNPFLEESIPDGQVVY